MHLIDLGQGEDLTMGCRGCLVSSGVWVEWRWTLLAHPQYMLRVHISPACPEDCFNKRVEVVGGQGKWLSLRTKRHLHWRLFLSTTGKQCEHLHRQDNGDSSDLCIQYQLKACTCCFCFSNTPISGRVLSGGREEKHTIKGNRTTLDLTLKDSAPATWDKHWS